MKKVAAFFIAVLLAGAAMAQDPHDMDREVFNVTSIIFLIFLVMLFILAFLKRLLDYRLRNKIVDKGISEDLASSLLATTPQDSKQVNVKWFAILAGTALGLSIVYYTEPLGIHSLAIMCFCISLSFLGYYFYLKKSGE